MFVKNVQNILRGQIFRKKERSSKNKLHPSDTCSADKMLDLWHKEM